MKKQFIIEVEEAQHDYSDIFTPQNYKAPGFYLNTTPDGFKQLVYNPENENFAPFGIYDITGAPEIMNHLKPVATGQEPQPAQQSAATITNTELLKFIAIAREPELITEIIKTEAALNVSKG